MRLPRFPGLALAASTLIGAQAGEAMAACTVVMLPGLCESEWLADPEFWKGDYNVNAGPSIMIADGVANSLATMHATSGHAEVKVITKGGVRQLEIDIGGDFPAVASVGQEQDLITFQKYFKEYSNDIKDLITIPSNIESLLGELSQSYEPEAGPVAELFGLIMAESVFSERLRKEIAKKYTYYLAACGDDEPAVKIWRADVKTKDEANPLLMQMYFFMQNPRAIGALLHADTKYTASHKQVDVKVYQSFLLNRSVRDIPGAVETEIEDDNACARIRREEPWRMIRG